MWLNSTITILYTYNSTPQSEILNQPQFYDFLIEYEIIMI